MELPSTLHEDPEYLSIDQLIEEAIYLRELLVTMKPGDDSTVSTRPGIPVYTYVPKIPRSGNTLLEYLLANKGNISNRQRVEVWMRSQDIKLPNERSIDIIIYRLRKKFLLLNLPYRIETLNSVGWILHDLQHDEDTYNAG